MSEPMEVDLKIDPHDGAREAVDRLLGTMGHASMDYLVDQLSMASTVANLRRSWNWLSAETGVSGQGGQAGGPESGLCPA